MNIIFFDLNRFNYERGCEKQLVELAKNLAHLGHKVFLVGESYLYIEVRTRIENIVYRIFTIKIRHDVKNKIKIDRNFHDIQKEVLDIWFHMPFSQSRRRIMDILRKADVIYAKNEFIDCAYLYYLIGKKDFAKKVIIGIHTAIFGYGENSFHARVHNKLYFSPFYKKMLNLCRFIHIPNKSYKSLLIDYFNILDKKIHYLPYIIDDENEDFSPIENKKVFNILFAGTLTEQKGVDYLRDIVTYLSSKSFFKDLKFFIAGQGDQGYIVKELTTRFSNVHFFGFVKEMNELYQKTDISIVPSRWETVSYITLESQSRGIPVVSFDIPGPQDIIVDGQTGFLVKPKDIISFCEKIVFLYNKKINSPQEFNTIKENSQQNIKTNFLKDKTIKKFESLLNGLKDQTQ
jgi:glycosyltransferase involved in cell wall biosynthesis